MSSPIKLFRQNRDKTMKKLVIDISDQSQVTTKIGGNQGLYSQHFIFIVTYEQAQ
jgi:hypothetical protein